MLAESCSINSPVESLKEAVRSPSSCNPDIVSILKQLLLNSADVHHLQTDTKQSRQFGKVADASRLKGTCVQPKLAAKVAVFPGTTAGPASKNKKLALATEIFNLASKTLSEYSKKSEPTSGRSVLQGTSPNRKIRTSQIPKTHRRDQVIEDTGIVSIANCARLTLAILRDLRQNVANGEVFNSQLEQGCCVLVGKLMAAGLNDIAIIELVKLKRRILGYLENNAVGDKGMKDSGAQLDEKPTRETFLELLHFNTPPPSGPLSGLIISFQLLVLKVLLTEKKPSSVIKMTDFLHLSNPHSAANIIVYSYQHGFIMEDKATQQLQSLSHSILSLSLLLSNDQVVEKPPVLGGLPLKTLDLQILALEVRSMWWIICKHKPDEVKELWDPLSRYMTSFSRRCPNVDPDSFLLLKEMFLRLSSSIKKNGRFSNFNYTPKAIVMTILGQKAQSAGCISDAIKFYNDSVPSLVPEQSVLLAINRCKIAQLLLISSSPPEIEFSRIHKTISDVAICLIGPLKGNHADLDELVVEAAKLKRMGMAYLTAQGNSHMIFNNRSSHQNLLAICIIDYLSSFVRFLSRYIRQSHKSERESDNSIQKRLSKFRNVILAAVDSIVAVAKIAVISEDRPSWDETQPLLSDSLLLLDVLLSHSINDPNANYPLGFIKVSNIYWSRYLRQKELGKSLKELISLLEKSTSILQCFPSPVQNKGFLAIKYERLAVLYFDNCQIEKSEAAYRSSINSHIQSGLLAEAAEVVKVRPLLHVLKDQSSPAFHFNKILSHYMKCRGKEKLESYITTFDDLSLESSERAVLLECQLFTISDVVISRSLDELPMAVPFLIQSLLHLYPFEVHPIRRSRLLLQAIRLSLDTPGKLDDSLFEIIRRESESLSSMPSDLVNDSQLSAFGDSIFASLRLSRGFLFGHPSIEDLEFAIRTWASILDACKTWTCVHARIEDPESWVSQIKILIEYLAVRGFWRLRLLSLFVLQHALEVKNDSNPEELFRCMAQIASQHSHLGYQTWAKPIFLRASDILKCYDISPMTTISFDISFAEHLIETGDVDQATATMVSARTLFENCIHEVSQSNFQTRTAWERQVADATYVQSKISFESGNFNHSLFFAKLAVKLNSRIWARLDKRFEKRQEKASPKNDQGVDKIAERLNNLSLSVAKKDPTFREGCLYWQHFVPHFSALLSLSKLCGDSGLYQDTIYYAEQALKVAKEIGAVSSVVMAQGLLARQLICGGQMGKGQEMLATVANTIKSVDCSADAIALLSDISYLQASFDVEEAQSFNVVLDALQTFTQATIPQIFSTVKNDINKNITGQLTTDKRAEQGKVGNKTRQTRRSQPTTKKGTATRAQSVISKIETSESDTYRLRSKVLRRQAESYISLQAPDDVANILEELEKLPSLNQGFLSQQIIKAEYLLMESIRSLSRHSMYCVLAESAISLPAAKQVLLPQKSTTGSDPKIRFESIAKKGTSTKTRAQHSNVEDFSSMLVTANSILTGICHRAKLCGSTQKNRRISNLLGEVTLLHSATSPSSCTFSDPVHLSYIIENGGNFSFMREKYSILADKGLSGNVDAFSWPIVCENINDSDVNVTECDINLPYEWNVLSMKISANHKDFLITRIRSGETPLTLRLPLNRSNSEDVDDEEGCFGFDEGKAEMREIIRLANESAHDSRVRTDRASKKEWWTNREVLDKRLKDLLQNIESLWFGGFRGIFSPKRQRPLLLAKFAASFDKILNKHMPSSRRRGRGKQTKVEISNDILDLFLKIEILEEEDAEALVMDLLYFAVDILQFNGERNAYDEIDFDMMVVETLDAIRKYQEEENRMKQEESHTILVLDRELHVFPWESMNFLRGHSVSRVPSLYCLTERLRRIRSRDRKSGIYVNKSDVSYILNPGGDLTSTQSMFETPLSDMDGWTGISNRAPSEDEFKHSLENKDVMLYFGHGSGAQYIRGRTIRRLEKCAVTFLMGCSSGVLAEAREFEPYGIPMNYMHAGAGALVATLWDVTDKDIDRFAQTTFENWGLIAPIHVGRPTQTRTSRDIQPCQIYNDSVGLDSAISKARDACIFKYLNGAAPVVYGVPVFFN